MFKSLGVTVAGIALVISLVASWGHFYSEQKVNTEKIKMLQGDKKDLANIVYTLNHNQAKLIQNVSNNTENTKALRQDFKQVLDLLNKNRVIIAKIAGKVGASE